MVAPFVSEKTVGKASLFFSSFWEFSVSDVNLVVK